MPLSLVACKHFRRQGLLTILQIILQVPVWKKGNVVAQWLRCCATNRKVAGSIPAGISGFFIDIKSFRSHYSPRVDSASNRNEYQEHFLGVKSSRCVRLTTLPPSCAVVTKSGSLNFLEPSGPVQACNGTDLTLPLPVWKKSNAVTFFHWWFCQGGFTYGQEPTIIIYPPRNISLI